jgi:hypothetical protein
LELYSGFQDFSHNTIHISSDQGPDIHLVKSGSDYAFVFLKRVDDVLVQEGAIKFLVAPGKAVITEASYLGEDVKKALSTALENYMGFHKMRVSYLPSSDGRPAHSL